MTDKNISKKEKKKNKTRKEAKQNKQKKNNILIFNKHDN